MTTDQGAALRIKPEYYCEEYKDAIDVRNAALVVALRQAKAIKCEELRQRALREIKKRKREVPDQQQCGGSRRRAQVLSPFRLSSK